MTSSYVGLAVFDLLLFATGVGILYAIGLVRTRRNVLRHAALALAAGWAAGGIATSTALAFGAPLNRWDITLMCVAIAGAGVLVGRRVAPHPIRALGDSGLASWIAVAGAGVVFVELAALFRRAVAEGAPIQWDAWGFWLPKARSIIDFGGLDTGIGGFTSFANPGYPLFVPSLQASLFSFMGNVKASPLAVQDWVIAVAFFGALASLLAVRVRPAILWPCLALLAVMPTFTALIGSSLGDEPLMLLLGLGCGSAALWLLVRERQYAVLAGLFLAAAALAKNEGLPTALVLAGTLLVAAVVRRPRQPLVPALVLLAPVAAVVPWRLWMRAHNIRASYDYRFSDLLHPAVLSARTNRLSYAANHLPGHIFDTKQWLLAIPLLLAAVVLALPRRPALAILAVVSVTEVIGALLIIYWIGSPPVDWYVATSADRVIASAVVMAMVFIPLLLAEASRREASPG